MRSPHSPRKSSFPSAAARRLPVALAFFGLIVFLSACGNGDESVELPAVKDVELTLESGGELDPVADPAARRGGSFTTWGSEFPKSLNGWLDFNSTSAEINGFLFESLVGLHTVRNEPVPLLARTWSRSPDGSVFTFHLDPAARWSDGRPVTAEDVQFYYDVIMDKKHLTPIFRIDLARFARPEVVDPHTLRVKAKQKHWRNFWNAAGMRAFPKHIWSGKDFNKINFEFPVVSGPYELKDVKKNRYVLLKRRGDWWGRTRRFNQHKYNFDYIRYRFIGDRNKALEAFKKGDLDVYAIYTAKIWAVQTDFEAQKKNWVVRQEVFNQEPRGFQGFAINLRRKKFQDPLVREALCLLLNREQMNEKFMFNSYFLLNSYFPDLFPGNRNPAVRSCPYDPARARALLKQAGWKVGAQGTLEKDGQPFEVVFLTSMTDLRHLELYSGDLKAVGIQPKIDTTSNATIRTRLDQHDFDLYWAAWGASRLRDPESMWHSSTADQKASQNFPGVKDARIDAWIEEQRGNFDINQRNDILKRIDLRLNEIRPYVLLWQSDRTRLLYWNRFGKPRSVLGKFDREDAALVYWWVEPSREKALTEARRKGAGLPAEPSVVRWAER